MVKHKLLLRPLQAEHQSGGRARGGGVAAACLGGTLAQVQRQILAYRGGGGGGLNTRVVAEPGVAEWQPHVLVAHLRRCRGGG